MSPLLRFLVLTLALLTLVRLMLGMVLDVTPQEAYWAQCAQRGEWIGCDGGGLSAWLSGLAGWFPHSSLAVRFAAPLLALVGCWLLFGLVENLASERTAAWAVVILNLLPAFNLGAILLQPEWIAAYAMLGGMKLLWTGLHRAGTWDWHWPVAGGLWGVALLCHWTALSLPISVAFLFLASRRWRKRLFRPGPWLLLAGWFVVGILPLLWWDATHGQAFTDLLMARLGWHDVRWFDWSSVAGLLIQSLVAFSPLLAVAAGIAIVRVVRAKPREDAAYFLLAFTLPVAAAMSVAAIVGLGHTSFLIPALLPIAGLLAMVWQPRSAVRDRQSLWQWIALGSAAACSLVLLNTDLLRRVGIVREYRWDTTRKWHGWKETAAEAGRIIQDTAQQAPESVPLLVIAETPELASILEFYLPNSLPLLQPQPEWPRIQVLESPVATSQFAFWPRYDAESPPGETAAPALGRNALFFTEMENRTGPPGTLAASFAEVNPLMVFEIRRLGAVIRRIKVFVCLDYRGAPM